MDSIELRPDFDLSDSKCTSRNPDGDEANVCTWLAARQQASVKEGRFLIKISETAFSPFLDGIPVVGRSRLGASVPGTSVHIEGPLTIDIFQNPEFILSQGIDFQRFEEVHLKDVWFKGSAGRLDEEGNVIPLDNNEVGIRISGSTPKAVTVENCFFTNMERPFRLGVTTDPHPVRILNSQFGIGPDGEVGERLRGVEVHVVPVFPLPRENNLIMGNVFSAVQLDAALRVVGDEAAIESNIFGSDKTGAQLIPNERTALRVDGNSAEILNNLITNSKGIALSIDGDDNLARQNIILSNANHGVRVKGQRNTLEENQILESGIEIPMVEEDSQGADARASTIGPSGAFDEDLLGIALSTNRVTLNDRLDADEGSNQLLNYPILNAFTGDRVTGLLHGKPSETYTIELFEATQCNPTGFGEGDVFRTKIEVTTDGDGEVEFSIPPGDLSMPFRTATATDSEGNTSEFSPCAASTDIGGDPVVTTGILPSTPDNNDRFLHYFPYYRDDANNFVGYAVSNFSDELARIEFTAYGDRGALLQDSKNPNRDLGLQSLNQLAMVGSQIFQNDPAKSKQAWIELATDQERVASFFQLGSNDLQQLDGGVAWRGMTKKMIFTRVFDGAATFRGKRAKTRVTLINPTLAPIVVKVRYFGSTSDPFPQGDPIENTVNLPPRASYELRRILRRLHRG